MSASSGPGSPPADSSGPALRDPASGGLAEGASSSQSPSYTSQGASPNSPAGKPIRRRMRMITSCLECRRRKLKCNKKSPCENCVKFSRECVFLSSKLDEASQIRLTEIKEKVGSLERALERDIAKPGSSSRVPSQQRLVVDDIEYEFADDLDPWPSFFVSVDKEHAQDALEGIEDVLDLGVQVGRMRITDHMGGLPRPQLSEELLAAIGSSVPSAQSADTSVPTAGLTNWAPGPTPDGSVPDFMRPGPTYIAPSSGFALGQAAHPSTPLDMLLPPRTTCDQLMEQYFRAVHPVARCLHKPSFREDYQGFWDDVCSSAGPKASLQALMFSVMFSAAASLGEKEAVDRFGRDKRVLVGNLQIGAEAALCKASFLRTTRTETVQALVIYLLPLCRAEVSRAHSSLVGAAIRLAESIGLHRDGESYGLNPVDTHVRRLIWHQLCFLDIRAAEAHGPRPFIRRDEYDVKLPVNCEESAIRVNGPSPVAEEQWTPILLSLIRFEINEMMRVVWHDRRKLESKKMLLTELLSKTEDFRKRMIVKYEGMLSDEDPIQRYTKLVMHLLLYRLYAMVLHRYYRTWDSQLPQQLSNVLLMAGIMIVEIAIQIENDRLFRDWVWYFGAYVQYQVALLLATEAFSAPNGRDSARIWACLDYVFSLDRQMPSELKTLHILNEIQTKSAVYNSIRGIRSPRLTKATSPASGLDAESIGYGRESISPERLSILGDEQQQQQQHLQSYYQQQTPTSSQSDTALLAGSLNLVQPPGQSSRGVDNRGHAPHLAGMTFSGYSGFGEVLANPAINELEDVDWEALNSIFPADPTTGEFNLAGFHDPSISINWQQWR